MSITSRTTALLALCLTAATVLGTPLTLDRISGRDALVATMLIAPLARQSASLAEDLHTIMKTIVARTLCSPYPVKAQAEETLGVLAPLARKLLSAGSAAANTDIGLAALYSSVLSSSAQTVDVKESAYRQALTEIATLSQEKSRAVETARQKDSAAASLILGNARKNALETLNTVDYLLNEAQSAADVAKTLNLQIQATAIMAISLNITRPNYSAPGPKSISGVIY